MDEDLPNVSWKHARPFRLGDLEILPASGEIRGWDGTRRIRPLLMDLLLRLAFEPGSVVRRETLLADVWPRRMVNDEVLSRAMAELRGLVGDDVKSARYIETLPKIGYRLVAPVTPLEAEAPAVPLEVAAATASSAVPVPAASTVEPTAAPSPPRPRNRSTLAGAAVAVVVAATFGLVTWHPWTRPSTADAALEQRLHAARTFTSDPGRELGPRFSPDGTRVAYSLADGEGAARIVVRGVDGKVQATIGGSEAVLRLSPVFLPDGKRLAYWRADNATCAIAEWDLEAGRETRVLVDCARQPRARFDVSRDGRWLVFAAPPRPQFPAGLHVLDMASGTVRVLTAPDPGIGDDVLPRFDPGGARIAFFRGNESHRALWIVEREGGEPRRVSRLDGLSYGAAWLGRDGPLLVAADWFGFRALNLLDPASGDARLAGARGARYPDVAADGAIVFENAMYAANLWRISLDGTGRPGMLWPSTRYTNQPEISPDGHRVAFASNRDGNDAIYVADFDGQPLRIAGTDRSRFLRPHWSGDGRAIHAVRLTVEPNGRLVQEAVRIAADGSRLDVLGGLGSAVNDVRETRDGRWLLWAENAGTAMRLMRAPVDKPAASERLPWPLVSHFEVSGERVALTQPQLPTLMLCRLPDLACERTEVHVSEANLYHWALGPRSVFLRGIDGRVARYDLASRQVVATYPAEPSGGGTSIAVSDDEREMVFIREEGPAIDLMIAPRPDATSR